MSDLINTVDFENEVDIQQILSDELDKNTNIVSYAMKLYTYQTGKIKQSVEQHAAEILQKQERIKLLHDIIQKFNRLSNESEVVDISSNRELLEKIALAREIGVEIPEKTSFSSREMNYLLENLHMKADDFDKENKVLTQKMHVLIQESDRFLMIANLFIKTDDRTKTAITRNIKS